MSSPRATPRPLALLLATALALLVSARLFAFSVIGLSATDTSGRIVTDGPIAVVVEGNMKVGAFTLAFEDLKVPVAGVPITLTPTYDGRDVRAGDFGPGWRLALANIRVQKSRALGTGWHQTDPNGLSLQAYFVDPVGEKPPKVVFPDGEPHLWSGEQT